MDTINCALLVARLALQRLVLQTPELKKLERKDKRYIATIELNLVRVMPG